MTQYVLYIGYDIWRYNCNKIFKRLNKYIYFLQQFFLSYFFSKIIIITRHHLCLFPRNLATFRICKSSMGFYFFSNFFTLLTSYLPLLSPSIFFFYYYYYYTLQIYKLPFLLICKKRQFVIAIP